MTAAAPGGTANLLLAFDPSWSNASKHAKRPMTGPFRPRIYRPQGWISPVLLVDGRMEGVWAHKKKKGDRLAVIVSPSDGCRRL